MTAGALVTATPLRFRAGRGESAADHLLHEGKLFPGGPQHAHDRAADSYHRYKDDIAMAAQLKVKWLKDKAVILMQFP